jgi:ABC-type multidrug transport system permease subunit
VLPLTYLLDLIRDVFVNGEGLESALASVAVIAVWGAIGFLLALRMFKWEPREV